MGFGTGGATGRSQQHTALVANTSSTQGNVKGKLTALDEMVTTLADELHFHKREVQMLRSEKDALESVLTTKTGDMRKTLTTELKKVEDEMKRHYAHQKGENGRIQQQVTNLKAEKTTLDMQLLELERRMAELELQMGHDPSLQ